MFPEQGKISSKVEVYPLSRKELERNIERLIPNSIDAERFGSPYVAYNETESDFEP